MLFRSTIKKKLGIDNVLIFPNAVNENESQFKPNPIKSERIRFGWLGGSSHLYDIELLEQGIASTHNSFKDKVQFVLCGFDLRGTVHEIDRNTGQQRQRDITPTETVWYKYEKIFTENYKVVSEDYKTYLHLFTEYPQYKSIDVPYRRIWTQEITKYANNYNLFDVSLAPIVESEFNANKSDKLILLREAILLNVSPFLIVYVPPF